VLQLPQLPLHADLGQLLCVLALLLLLFLLHQLLLTLGLAGALLFLLLCWMLGLAARI